MMMMMNLPLVNDAFLTDILLVTESSCDKDCVWMRDSIDLVIYESGDRWSQYAYESGEL